MTIFKRWTTLRFAVGRALIHAGLRVLPPGRVRSELFSLSERWATHARGVVRAHQPSADAVRWAKEVAGENQASPPTYLSRDEEAAFRRRLFGSRRDDNQENRHEH